MHPEPDSFPATDDTLRRQLILAQVQLMELEDTRDDLRSQLVAARNLLARTQTLADRSLEDRERLANDLQERLAAQQTASESLRSELTAALGRETALAARIAALEPQLAATTHSLAEATASAAVQQKRITQLETERRAMKASWSWRCTAPLRSLGRLLHRGGPSA
jgi:predicted  nucleic acid-binding Zn-ribbon protein